MATYLPSTVCIRTVFSHSFRIHQRFIVFAILLSKLKYILRISGILCIVSTRLWWIIPSAGCSIQWKTIFRYTQYAILFRPAFVLIIIYQSYIPELYKNLCKHRLIDSTWCLLNHCLQKLAKMTIVVTQFVRMIIPGMASIWMFWDSGAFQKTLFQCPQQQRQHLFYTTIPMVNFSDTIQH